MLWFDESGAVESASIGPKGIVVGRDPACDMGLPSQRLSRRHCAVQLANGGIVVEDLAASNGTFVNRQQVGPEPHAVGDDVIEVGGAAVALIGQAVRDAITKILRRIASICVRKAVEGQYPTWPALWRFNSLIRTPPRQECFDGELP